MPKTIRREIPGIFAEEFRDGAKNAAFDQHSPMQIVDPMQMSEPLDRESKENNAALPRQDYPAVDGTVCPLLAG